MSEKLSPEDKHGCIGLAIGFIAGVVLGVIICRDVWRMKVVRHGAAEYVITNPETGATEFRWKGE